MMIMGKSMVNKWVNVKLSLQLYKKGVPKCLGKRLPCLYRLEPWVILYQVSLHCENLPMQYIEMLLFFVFFCFVFVVKMKIFS